ncbi:MAG: hypothetical protein CR967_02575 [Proteobacteria bacterium]|nr:MAG: hypothetical protein CR967_02575 [Pseudomonadota bacterium]
MEVQSIKSVSEMIQLSITPVFMIAGVSGFLAVFTGRLARIVDRLEKIDEYLQKNKKCDKLIMKQKDTLVKRIKNINLSILLMTSTGLFVAFVMISMFLSISFNFSDFTFITLLFMSSIICLILSLLMFAREIVYAVTSANGSGDFLHG